MGFDITLGKNALNQVRLVRDSQEILLQEINTLLFMRPGFDEENPDKGVDIRSFSGTLMGSEIKTQLEDRIRENLQNYLGASCTNILYDEPNNSNEITITLEFMKEGQSYLFRVDPKASSNSLIKYISK